MGFRRPPRRGCALVRDRTEVGQGQGPSYRVRPSLADAEVHGRVPVGVPGVPAHPRSGILRAERGVVPGGDDLHVAGAVERQVAALRAVDTWYSRPEDTPVRASRRSCAACSRPACGWPSRPGRSSRTRTARRCRRSTSRRCASRPRQGCGCRLIRWMRSVARPRGPREPRRTQKTRGTREMPGTPQKAGWRRRSEPRLLLPGGVPGLSDPASCAASLGASASHSSGPDIGTGLPVKRDRCHHLPFPPNNLGCLAGTALTCLPPYLRITRSTPLSVDTRFLGPRVAVRSH